uniref:C6 domain-containing protein n=1 Tax=Plectus sambesii TaxID=2011161 RepID=A0A914UYD3_9BILA
MTRQTTTTTTAAPTCPDPTPLFTVAPLVPSSGAPSLSVFTTGGPAPIGQTVDAICAGRATFIIKYDSGVELCQGINNFPPVSELITLTCQSSGAWSVAAVDNFASPGPASGPITVPGKILCQTTPIASPTPVICTAQVPL